MEHALTAIGAIVCLAMFVTVIIGTIVAFVADCNLTKLEKRVAVLEKENTNATP